MNIRDRLDRAKQNLVCADYIDNWQRREKEVARWSAEVKRMEQRIKEIEELVGHE